VSSVSASLPLEGLRVLDFTRLLPGPYATLVLADLGADVIKVEAPQGGDYLRWMPPLTGKASYAFHALNAGKRSLAVDLKRPAGVALVAALAGRADVVIESFRPGVMDRLGLGYGALSEANPGLVYCALTGFGQDGPYREEPGHDLNYAALAGVIGLSGPTDGPPQVPPVQIADYGGGLWSLIGVLAALEQRHRTGRGQLVDVSMTDGALGFLTAALAPHIGGGAPAPARGADVLTGGQACYGVYETRDGGFMSVAPLEPKFWAAFCQAVGRPEWLRRQFDGRLRDEVAALFKERMRAEWEDVFRDTGACCHPVLAPEEVPGHPLHAARGNVIADEAGRLRLKTPIRPRDAPAPGSAPALGADSRAIARELGYDEDAIDALVASGVLLAPG